jgi:hypothetical protein
LFPFLATRPPPLYTSSPPWISTDLSADTTSAASDDGSLAGQIEEVEVRHMMKGFLKNNKHIARGVIVRNGTHYTNTIKRSHKQGAYQSKKAVLVD